MLFLLNEAKLSLMRGREDPLNLGGICPGKLSPHMCCSTLGRARFLGKSVGLNEAEDLNFKAVCVWIFHMSSSSIFRRGSVWQQKKDLKWLISGRKRTYTTTKAELRAFAIHDSSGHYRLWCSPGRGRKKDRQRTKKEWILKTYRVSTRVEKEKKPAWRPKRAAGEGSGFVGFTLDML